MTLGKQAIKIPPSYYITRGGVTFSLNPDGSSSISYSTRVCGYDENDKPLLSEEALRGKAEILKLKMDKTLLWFIRRYLIGPGRN